METITRYIKENYVSKDKIMKAMKITSKDIKECKAKGSTDTEYLLRMIKLYADEFERLEDIEDKKVQIEYNLVYNKGYQDCKTKYLNKIKEKRDKDIHTNEHTILGRRNKRTLEYGIRLGRIQMCEELLEE